jgi:hypothetical protein
MGIGPWYLSPISFTLKLKKMAYVIWFWIGCYICNVLERYIRLTHEKTKEIIQMGIVRVWFNGAGFESFFKHVGRFMLSPFVLLYEYTPEWHLKIEKKSFGEKIQFYMAGRRVFEKYKSHDPTKPPHVQEWDVEDYVKLLKRNEVYSQYNGQLYIAALDYLAFKFMLPNNRYTVKEMEQFVPKKYLLQFRKQTKDILLAREHGEYLLNRYEWTKVGLFHLISHAFGSKSQQLWYQIQKEDSEEPTNYD